ncbi:MAG: hypothetical protein KBS70_02800 [Bacteroidales bacterium]|nr:hypothetical protein [Candidatus Colicola equi]
MGNSAPQRDARSLREILAGLNRVEQHKAAALWAVANGRAIDMFGTFAQERHLLLFQSGNECENWIDPIDNVLYKMNTLTHVGEDLVKLLDRIDIYNTLFPETAMRLVGFQIMREDCVFPIFTQPFIKNAQFATEKEIVAYMSTRGFQPTGEDGKFTNGEFLVWDIKPKNVLHIMNGIIFVIDAEIEKLR